MTAPLFSIININISSWQSIEHSIHYKYHLLYCIFNPYSNLHNTIIITKQNANANAKPMVTKHIINNNSMSLSPTQYYINHTWCIYNQSLSNIVSFWAVYCVYKGGFIGRYKLYHSKEIQTYDVSNCVCVVVCISAPSHTFQSSLSTI